MLKLYLIIGIFIVGSISKAYAIKAEFSLNTFKNNNEDSVELVDTFGVLMGYTTVYNPQQEIEVKTEEAVSLSNYCNIVKVIEGKVVRIKAIFHSSVDWLYIEDTDGKFSGWVDTKQLYIIPDNLDLIKENVTESDLDNLVKALGSAYSLYGKTLGESENINEATKYNNGFLDTSLNEELFNQIELGIDKVKIEKPKIFYETEDKYQIAITVIIMMLIMVVSTYIYTSLWGENAEDTMASTITTSLCICVSHLLMLVISIIQSINTDEKLTAAQVFVLIGPLIIGIIANGIINYETERVSNPLIYSICSYWVVITIDVAFILEYNKNINPEFFDFISRFRINSNNISVIHQTEFNLCIVMLLILVFIAIYNRYSSGLSIERQRQTHKREITLLKAMQEDIEEINEYKLTLKRKKFGYFDKIYTKNGLPTFNDLINRIFD